jgi:FtsP/CotA-like multicopper oxidase with cupredoxin domain
MVRLPVPVLSRRRFAQFGAAACGLAVLGRPARAPAAEPGAQSIKLRAAPTRVRLLPDEFPETDVWTYDGAEPGPTLHVQQNVPLSVAVENALPEATTVHWHGVRVPNAMDGVPGLTQPAIKPGEAFTYAFTPPDAGTFLYHSHADSLAQVGRGLAGALIVGEAAPPKVDRELVWVVQDWRLTPNGSIAPGFGNRMEAAMSGRVGNTVTINGRVTDAIPVRAGARVRLRIINAATGRLMRLAFAGHQPVVIARDGQPCDPHEPADGRLLLGPAMRADIMLDMAAEPGSRHAITDDFYGDELAYALTELVYDPGPPVRAHALDAPVRLRPNPLAEPDLASAVRHDIAIAGGMMSGMGMMGGMGMMRRRATWAINGVSMTGDGQKDMPPLFTIPRGRSCVLALNNETAWWHPMHLHGHSFRVLMRNGVGVPHREWGDTVLLAPRERAEIAFVADNPGDWMFHCHVTDHQMTGLMGVIRVA